MARHVRPQAGVAGQKTAFGITMDCLSQVFGQKLQITS